MSENPGGLHGDEPTPEEVLAGQNPADAVNVYLTDADLSAVASVLLGLREALRLLKGPDTPRVPLPEAEAVLTRFTEGEKPARIGDAEDEQHARAVADGALKASHGRVSIGIGLTDADIQQLGAEAAPSEPDFEPGDDEVVNHPAGPMSPITMPVLIPRGESPDDTPSLAACKMAVALMAQHEGNGTRALVWARILAETTGDGDWTGAARLILASLPLKDPTA